MGVRILVVEDEKIVAMEIKSRLETMEHEVVAIVSSGEEAIQMMSKHTPELVLMDIMLDGLMDGVQTAELIRARWEVPVIYITAYADEETLQRAKITEPLGYILKPFEERELYLAIELALYKHKMEKRLKESKQWFAITLRSIKDAVITTNVEGLVTFVNPVAEHLTGWLQNEALGKHFNEVFKTADKSQSDNPVEKVLKANEITILSESIYLESKQGTKRIIANNGAPIKDINGNILGVVFVFRDITQSRKLEEEIQKVQKLESIGILAGGIAHDFNNILTGILGNLSLILMTSELENETVELLKDIEKAALQAKGLTRQLLTFSKGGEPIKKVTSIGGIIRESAAFALRGSNISCELSLPNNLWLVEIDVGQFSQVIQNLVINANQAMPDGGSIRIVAENCRVKKEVGVSIRAGEYVKISVIDRGIGIPEKYLQKIFDPYFTTKNKGSGLGLATAFSIMNKHSGYITVESEINVGTKFHLYLPAIIEKVVEKHEITIDPKLIKGKVLVMDDEEFIRKTVCRMLEKMGLEVEVTKDGFDAIKTYIREQERNNPFDIVILDLTVPGGMGGKEAIQKLLEIDPNINAIVSSGYSNDPVMANYHHYGFKGVVVKPFQLEELKQAIAKVLIHRSKK